MATRAEQFRNQEQRLSKGETPPAKKRAPKGGQLAKPRAVPSNATYALEASAPDGRRSRKSTRASANRAKPDTNFNLRESLVKGSPEAAFARRAPSVRASEARTVDRSLADTNRRDATLRRGMDALAWRGEEPC